MKEIFKFASHFFVSLLLFTQILCFASSHSTLIDLSKYEKKVYSQNGEDGVIEKIFELIGATSKFYVEFGVENGHECNTRYLREHYQWQGLLMDGGAQDLSINLRREFITAENINQLFQFYQVPYEFDLLSIDIDSNDFYVWNTISDVYSPRVVVIEYNASHLPHEDKVVLYDPMRRWDGTNYYGASILAYYFLAQKKGYSLVYAENRGVNLFFIRNDVLKSCSVTFKNMNCVDLIYNPVNFNINGSSRGHPVDPYRREYTSARKILNLLTSPYISLIHK